MKTFLLTLVLLTAAFSATAKNWTMYSYTQTIYVDNPNAVTFYGQYSGKSGLTTSVVKEYTIARNSFTLVTSGEYTGYYAYTQTYDEWFETGALTKRHYLYVKPDNGYTVNRVAKVSGDYDCDAFFSAAGKTGEIQMFKHQFEENGQMAMVVNVDYKEILVDVNLICNKPSLLSAAGNYFSRSSKAEAPYNFDGQAWTKIEEGEYAGYYKSTVSLSTIMLGPNKTTLTLTPKSAYIYSIKGDYSMSTPTNSAVNVLNENFTADASKTYVIDIDNVIPVDVPVTNMRDDETITVNGTTYGKDDIKDGKLSLDVPVADPTMTIKFDDATHTGKVIVNGVEVQPSATGEYVINNLKPTDKVEIVLDSSADLYLTDMEEGEEVSVKIGDNPATTYTAADEKTGGVGPINVPEGETVVIKPTSDNEGRTGKVYVNDKPVTPNAQGECVISPVNTGDKIYVVFEEENKTEETVTFTSAHKTMTYSSHEDLYFPNEANQTVEAYQILLDTDGNLQLDRIYGRIPAHTGIYLQFNAEAKTKNAPKRAAATSDEVIYSIQRYTDQVADIPDLSGNQLKPLYQNELLSVSEPKSEVKDYSVYQFYDETVEAWVNNDSEDNQHSASTHNEAYVKTTVSAGKPAPFIPTAIETITVDGNDSAKTVEGIFSLSGMRFPAGTDVNSLAPGFYIVNGQKLLVK
ncbi:MAG: hypothetical protein HUK14_03890 [Muribaculaceae bacterium]|nr:hypothetical protein [Muribaculaceae bacterium]